MTRFARSVSSLSRIGPFGSVAHMVLIQLRVRANESTTANIGSMDGGAASGSGAASDFRPRNSITFCIVSIPNQNSLYNARPGCVRIVPHGHIGRLSS
jgi:hypothetical protein